LPVLLLPRPCGPRRLGANVSDHGLWTSADPRINTLRRVRDELYLALTAAKARETNARAFIRALDRYDRGEVGWRDVEPFLLALRHSVEACDDQE